MSKSYAALKPAIVSILVNHTLAVRERAVSVMEFERDIALEALVGKHAFYTVSLKTGKLSEEQVKAVNMQFTEKGFIGGAVEGANRIDFTGLAEGSADDLYAEVVAAVPDATKNFIRQNVKVKSADLICYLNEEVRKIVGC